jgi:hypothetical protein
MNTPLQTLEISRALLRDHPAQKDIVAEKIERAVERLNEINVLLTKFEKKVEAKIDSELPSDTDESRVD